MSDDIDLWSALSQAQQRLAALRDPAPARTLRETSAVAILRGIARSHSLDPDKVERDFLDGGPLAELARAVLGAEMSLRTKPRGRPPKSDQTWTTFVRVVLLMRQGRTQEAAIGEVAADTGMPEATVRDRYVRTRDRDGISPDSVPRDTIMALFSDPRPTRKNAKR